MKWTKCFLKTVFLISFSFGTFLSVDAVAGWTWDSANFGFNGFDTSLTLDSNQSPHMVYNDTFNNAGLKYAQKVSGNWNVETIYGSNNGQSSIALTGTNEPRIVFSKSGIGLMFASKVASSWTIIPIDPAGGTYTSIQIDGSDHYHVSYYSNSTLKYAKWDGVNWTTSTIDAGGNVGAWTSLALDRRGNPSISYYDWTNEDLKLAHWDGISWSTQTVATNGRSGRYSSLKIDSNDHPVISYIDEDGLKLAQWNGSQWDFQLVDDQGKYFTSLALNGGGEPRIAYQNSSAKLTLAYYSPSGWTKEIVPNSSENYISLALSVNDIPHVGSGSSVSYTKRDSLTPTSTAVASTMTATSITWSWSDDSSFESGYRILRASDKSALSPDLPANTNQWTQTGLMANTTSQIIVRALYGSEYTDGNPSLKRYTHAFKPSDLTLDSYSIYWATLSWSANGNPQGTWFQVEASVDGIRYSFPSSTTGYVMHNISGIMLASHLCWLHSHL
jgi:hypothetical protein